MATRTAAIHEHLQTDEQRPADIASERDHNDGAGAPEARGISPTGYGTSRRPARPWRRSELATTEPVLGARTLRKRRRIAFEIEPGRQVFEHARPGDGAILVTWPTRRATPELLAKRPAGRCIHECVIGAGRVPMDASCTVWLESRRAIPPSSRAAPSWLEIGVGHDEQMRTGNASAGAQPTARGLFGRQVQRRRDEGRDSRAAKQVDLPMPGRPLEGTSRG